jgi:hypothetical protein
MSDIKKQVTRNKGGRPKKPIKQRKFIGVKCSLVEKIVLRQKAKNVGLSLSEYLRETALNGQVVSRTKAFPKEILHITGTLNHLAANLNQIAKKRNQMDELNALESADLNVLSAQVKQLAIDIKKLLV